jgi:hypothetical protein
VLEKMAESVLVFYMVDRRAWCSVHLVLSINPALSRSRSRSRRLRRRRRGGGGGEEEVVV